MSAPTISIVIPTYNRAHLLERSIESVRREMLPGDELIVVDDGSTDDTPSVLARWGAEIRTLRIPNSGAGRARNVGVSHATCELVAFLDSDDEFMPGRLELPRRLLAAHSEILFTFSDMAATTRAGEVRRRFLIEWHQDQRSWEEILGTGVPYSSLAELPADIENFKVHIGNLFAALARAPYVPAQTATVRRLEAGESLFFDEDWPLYEDWGCFARLARAGQAAYLDVETAWQHSHTGPRLTSAAALAHAATRLELLKRIWGSDPRYLAAHRPEYDRLVEEVHGVKVRHLLVSGQRAEAARELETATRVPWYYAVMAMIPGPLILALMHLMHLVRHIRR